ncbi:tubulin epsilon and delta complex protein 2 isoform 1-T2 [Discoglossus pictus]
MLPASCSQRLLSVLNHALFNCKEEEKQLEEQIDLCHTLLNTWKTTESESLKQNETTSTCQEGELPVEELHEVELLNKALERALRVRGSFRGESSVKPTSYIQRAPSCPPTKEAPPKTAYKTAPSSTKTVQYLLNPPYKTNPEKKRVSNFRKVVATSSTELATIKDTYNRDGQSDTKEDFCRTEMAKSVSLPSFFPDVETTEEQLVTLKDKGATLKLPVEYRREYTRNSRLWEKFYETPHLRASQSEFIQKLQTTFTQGCTEMSLSELEEEVVRLEQILSSLQQSLNSSKKCQWTGPRHWQSYHSLLILEALQQETYQQLSALHQLQQAAEQHSNLYGQQPIGATYTEPRGCPASSCSGAPLLLYSNPAELTQLTVRRLQVLELQQKIYLHKVLREELLAEAESQCHKAPAYWMLYRAIYTQLCEGGDKFPVLVHDN